MLSSIISPSKKVASKLFDLSLDQDEAKENSKKALSTTIDLHGLNGQESKFKIPEDLSAVSSSKENEVQLEDEKEPLLKPNPRRFVMFPIQYPSVWHAYKNAESKFWSAEEIELSDDMKSWDLLPPKEKTLVKYLIGLLVSTDTIMGINMLSDLSDTVQIPGK